jgi:hypothetical protein
MDMREVEGAIMDIPEELRLTARPPAAVASPRSLPGMRQQLPNLS